MAEAAPLSLRLGAERLARIERHMARKGLSVRAAVVDLVDAGLEIAESPLDDSHMAPRKVAPPGYKPGAVTAEALRRLREEPGHD